MYDVAKNISAAYNPFVIIVRIYSIERMSSSKTERAVVDTEVHCM